MMWTGGKVTVTATTFTVGIVLLPAVGGALAALWMRARTASVDTKALAEAQAAARAAQPVADTLARIEAQMRELEAARRQSLGGMEASLAALSRDTVALANALRSPNARGRWGELTLRRVAELSGMSSYCDFIEQAAEDGKRPDMIVRIPD